VTITAREIYDAVMTLTSRVDDALDRSTRTADKVEDHEARIRSLEQLRWPLPTIGAVLALGAVLIALFHH
jgi:hypothetical protein